MRTGTSFRTRARSRAASGTQRTRHESELSSPRTHSPSRTVPYGAERGQAFGVAKAASGRRLGPTGARVSYLFPPWAPRLRSDGDEGRSDVDAAWTSDLARPAPTAES